MTTFMKYLVGLSRISILLVASINCFGQTFTFNIAQPAANALVGDSLPVQVSVASTYELQSVTATVEGRTSNLVF
ncbi:MAG TPA: hypothetical protein VFZ59_21965, partial [Verrucomicrobiae bacterium]|nr:hypothetical protein [Verrucomicrobiae bacterium]